MWSVAIMSARVGQRKNIIRLIEAFVMFGCRKMVKVSWTEYRTNESVTKELNVKRSLLLDIKRRKLTYSDHVTRVDFLLRDCTTTV